MFLQVVNFATGLFLGPFYSFYFKFRSATFSSYIFPISYMAVLLMSVMWLQFIMLKAFF